MIQLKQTYSSACKGLMLLCVLFISVVKPVQAFCNMEDFATAKKHASEIMTSPQDHFLYLGDVELYIEEENIEEEEDDLNASISVSNKNYVVVPIAHLDVCASFHPVCVSVPRYILFRSLKGY